MSDRYPVEPPSGYVKNDYKYDKKINEHVLSGGSICLDLLKNMQDHFKYKVGTGWSPIYNFKTLMIQLRDFL